MSNPDWYCPDVDPHGFVPFEYLEERAGRGSLERFLEEFPVPALVTVYREKDSEGGSGEILDPTDRGVQLLTMSIKSAAVLRYLGKVAFLAKRPGNPFAHLISVGRSSNNDITIAVDSISKVHGYFVAGDDGWSFTDHGSTNGSYLGDRQLASGQKHPLHDGDVLQLGLEVNFEYLAPESLYRRATRR